MPWWVWLALFLAAFSLFPLFEQSGYVRLVAFDTVLYMLLALGLNVVVGWGGLLDLGFVAFYGIGAYTYAFLDSNQFGIHLPTIVSVPVVVVVGALIGLMVGLPSRTAERRLPRDRHVVLPAALPDAHDERRQRQRPRHHRWAVRDPQRRSVQLLRPHARRRSTRACSPCRISTSRWAFFAVVFVALRFVNNSRTGRAWRSLREDSLAAEAMGMPVNRLKLVAFASGAAVAALTGTLFAALTASVFPLAFYFVLLITVYTMVILGGSGSQAGVVLGALIIGPLLEAPARPEQVARHLLHRAASAAWRSPRGSRAPSRWRQSGSSSSDSSCTRSPARCTRRGSPASTPAGWPASRPTGSSRPTQLARWVAPVTYVGVIAAVLLVTQLKGTLRLIALVPTLYLAAFVWENVMLAKPEPARYIVLGLILIGLMILRPNGLLGERRVEIDLMADVPGAARASRSSFGGLKVVDGLDLDVDEGAIVSVIGPNGAGKTTLFNLITGIYDPDEGDIRLDGKSIVGLQPHQITGRGISRTFQTLRLFLNMSVKENVMAAAYCHTQAGLFRSMLRTPGMRREEREIEAARPRPALVLR